MIEPKYQIVISRRSEETPRAIEVSFFSPETQSTIKSAVMDIAENQGIKCGESTVETLRISWSRFYTILQIIEEIIALVGGCVAIKKIALAKAGGSGETEHDSLPRISIEKLESEGKDITVSLRLSTQEE